MACPFRRAATQQKLTNGSAPGAGPSRGSIPSGRSDGLQSRQSSFHLLGDEHGEESALNLKHLSAALQILTSPKVSFF